MDPHLAVKGSAQNEAVLCWDLILLPVEKKNCYLKWENTPMCSFVIFYYFDSNRNIKY